MAPDDGTGLPVGKSGQLRPENVVSWSLLGLAVAPVVQSSLLWACVIAWATLVSGQELGASGPIGFWTIVGFGVIISYLVTATFGLATHVICYRLGFWRLWQYLLAGLLAGMLPAVLWGWLVAYQSVGERMLKMAVFTVPSAIVVSAVVWLFVFWRNPPPRSDVDLKAFS